MLSKSASVWGKKSFLLIYRPISVQFKFTHNVMCFIVSRKIGIIKGFEELFTRLKC